MRTLQAVAYAQFMLEVNLFDEYKHSLAVVIASQVSIQDLMCEINEEMLDRQQNQQNDATDDDSTDSEEEYEDDPDGDEGGERQDADSCESSCGFCREWKDLDSLFAEWEPNSVVGELCVQVVNAMK